MKCYYHEQREAVATCQHCGKALCRECASHYTPCLCEDCAQILREQKAQQTRTEAEKHRKKYMATLTDTRSGFLRRCVYGVIISLLLSLLFLWSGSPMDDVVSFAWLWFFIPFGWRALTIPQASQPLYFQIHPEAWLCWLAFKAVLSVLVGPLAFVYLLIKAIRAQQKLHAARQTLNKPASAVPNDADRR